MLKYVVVALKTICLMVDTLILNINSLLFELFLGLTRVGFSNVSVFEKLASRLYVLIGIFMVFRVTFSLIQMLANPDMMSDKEKGLGKLASRIVIALALLVLTPFIFEKAIQLQDTVLKENLIGQIVLGVDDSSNSTISAQGRGLAFHVFRGFVYPNDQADTSSEEWLKCKEAYDDTSITNIDNLITPGGNPSKLNCITDLSSNEQPYFTYLFGVSSIGGLILAWMVVGFCIDIATRLIKLGFYQIIAPIPIITYVNGDKNGPFSTWVKKCVSTYISVFVKLLIIYFVIYMCSIITSSGGLDMSIFDSSENGIAIKGLALVAIILGLIVFAQAAPKLIKDMFGIKDDEEGGFTKQLAKAALLGSAGMVAGGLTRSGANFRNFANVLKDPNAGFMDKAKAFGAGVGGLATGGLSGAFRNAKSGFNSKGWGNVFQDIGKNNARMNEIANRRFNNAATFRAMHPASDGFSSRLGARLSGSVTSGFDAVSQAIGGGTRAQRQDRVMENFKNISSLRDQMKRQADFFTGDTSAGVGNVKQLKQEYEDLMHSGTATETQIKFAREAYEIEQSRAITYLSNKEGHAVHALAVEMQKNVKEGQNSSYAQYFAGMDDVAQGNFSDDSTKKAFIDASNYQIIFENSADYKQAHYQANKNNK